MPRTTSIQRHLVALGGGGFSMELPPESSPLDDYLLRLTGKRRPRVCFIPTASGDALSYIDKFRAAFPGTRARASVLSLFKPTKDPATHLADQDLIYVGGGNTANLLAVWKLHGLDRALLARWKRGNVVFAGISAGMNCWFSACSTDSFGELAPLTGGLALLPFAACPHFDGEPQRRPTLLKWVAAGKLPPAYAADDYAALHFTAHGRSLKPSLHTCIKSRLTAGCYHVTRAGRTARIESLPTTLLTSPNA